MILILLTLLLLVFLLIIIIKALNDNSKFLEVELSIGIKCFKLNFKTKEKSTPSDQE